MGGGPLYNTNITMLDLSKEQERVQQDLYDQQQEELNEQSKRRQQYNKRVSKERYICLKLPSHCLHSRQRIIPFWSINQVGLPSLLLQLHQFIQLMIQQNFKWIQYHSCHLLYHPYQPLTEHHPLH